MTFKYQIVKEEQLLVQHAEGDFDLDCAKKYIEHLVNDPDWKYVTKILSDYKNLTVPKVPGISSILGELAQFRINAFQTTKPTVILVDKPDITAKVHIYSKKLNTNDGTENNTYCSSIHHAIKFLDLKIASDKLEHIISHLEKPFIAAA